MSNIVFGILSAVHSPATVRQLCAALSPHQVVIHHDFGQQPDFQVNLPNVAFVPDPKPTGWDSFNFTEGLFHLLEHCLQDQSMQYFQLLSPTCLPIKPVASFADYVSAGDTQIHADGIDLLADEQALVNFGYRTFVPDKSFRMRALFRTSELYFGKDCKEQMKAGLSVRVTDQSSLLRAGIHLLHRFVAKGGLGRHPFTAQWRPYMGSTWFGSSREALQWLVTQYQQDTRVNSFRALPFADELLVSTYLHNAPFKIAPANHLIATFNRARPQTFTPDALERLRASDKHLARKFADDPNDQTRLSILKQIS